MDFYLIDDKSGILEYASLARVNELNSLEKCLLIDFLIKSEEKKDKS